MCTRVLGAQNAHQDAPSTASEVNSCICLAFVITEYGEFGFHFFICLFSTIVVSLDRSDME